jgi:hypothetical protein
VQERVVESAYKRRAFAKREAVTDEGPDHGDQRHQHEALHHGGQHVFAADQASVK